MSKEIGKVYLHVGNGGFTFKVLDDGHGPTFSVESGFFGHTTCEMKMMTNREGLLSIRDMLDKALNKTFSSEYCESAKVKE